MYTICTLFRIPGYITTWIYSIVYNRAHCIGQCIPDCNALNMSFHSSLFKNNKCDFCLFFYQTDRRWLIVIQQECKMPQTAEHGALFYWITPFMDKIHPACLKIHFLNKIFCKWIFAKGDVWMFFHKFLFVTRDQRKYSSEIT